MNQAQLEALIAKTGTNWDGNPIGPEIILPPGRISLSSTLTISDRADLVIRGQGELSTELFYSGAVDSDAVVLDHCRNCRLENLAVTSQSGTPRRNGVVIKTSNPGPAWPDSGGNFFKEVDVGGFEVGYYVDSSANDTDNADHVWERCHVANNTVAGWRIDGQTNGKGMKFRWCSGYRNGIGVWAETITDFVWQEGQGTQNDVDFQCDDGTWIQATIDGHRTENSKRFFVTADAQKALKIIIQRVTYDLNFGDQSVAYGTSMIETHTSGPISFESLGFNSTGSSASPPIIFDIDSDNAGIIAVNAAFAIKAPANGDFYQRPIRISSTMTVFDLGVRSRALTGGFGSLRNELSPADDPDDGRTSVTLPKTTFANTEFDTLDWQTDLALPLSDGTKLRSFTIALDITFTDLATLTDVEICNAAGLSVWFQKNNGTYTATVGGTSIAVAGISLATSTAYRMVLSYDRDYQNAMFRFGSLVTTQSAATTSILDDNGTNSLQLGSKETSPVTGKFIGTLANCSVWDRVFSSANEVTIEDAIPVTLEGLDN